MRRALSALLVCLALVTLAACGDDDAAENAAPLSEHVITEADAPGWNPDPVEEGESTEDLDDLVAVLSDLTGSDSAEITSTFSDAGFVAAISDTRFSGETHSNEVPHLASSAIQLESDDGAEAAHEWLVDADAKPCPETCALRISTFEVDGMSDAKGTLRSASAEDIEALGKPGDAPFELYVIRFTNGPMAYSVELRSRGTGVVTQEEAVEIATALRARVDDLGPPAADTSGP